MRLEVGKDDEDALNGGVLDLDGSFMVVEWVEGGNVGSGDNAGGVCWGTVGPNSSVWRRVSKVRFCSSSKYESTS